MKTLLLRSFGLPALLAALILLLLLGLMLVSLARNLDRMHPLEAHLAVLQRVQGQSLAMQQALARGLTADRPADRQLVALLQTQVRALAQDPAVLSARARDDLRRAHLSLQGAPAAPGAAVQAGLVLIHQALDEEARAHRALLVAVRQQAKLEFRLAAGAFVLVPLAAIIVLYLLRRRILYPLADLNVLMERLARHDFAPAELRQADSLLAPLLARYNQMVARLAELESAQQAQRASLEDAVRVASRELVSTHRSLAEADKLAAVGELAASLAHELRNPVAGIQLALANLRQELPDADARARLGSVIDELRRMTTLLNALLNQARHAPEAAQPVRLARAVNELLTLARYQSPPGVVFEQAVPDRLVCELPEGRLRQALLNLILNAAQLVGETGWVRLSARYEAKQLVIEVEDDGPGFSEAMLQSGVQAFGSQRPGGTGLGLATVRRFALDLGGSLQLDNRQPRGARVCLRLPCVQPTEF